MGASRRPAFPAPSRCDEGDLLDNSDAARRENADCRHPPLSCPASSGAPSIPEAYRLCTKVSGILDRPVEPGDDGAESAECRGATGKGMPTRFYSAAFAA